MTDTTTRGEAYAARFAAANDEIIALVEGCTAAQWRQTCFDEERSVAVVAHHVGAVNGAFAGMVARLAAGETYSPKADWGKIHEANAQHAREYAAVEKAEALGLLRSNGEAIVAQLRAIPDATYDQHAGNFGGNDMSVAQVTEFVVIGHTASHLVSIKGTVAG